MVNALFLKVLKVLFDILYVCVPEWGWEEKCKTFKQLAICLVHQGEAGGGEKRSGL